MQWDGPGKRHAVTRRLRWKKREMESRCHLHPTVTRPTKLRQPIKAVGFITGPLTSEQIDGQEDEAIGRHLLFAATHSFKTST
jgi:hypothetical protein